MSSRRRIANCIAVSLLLVTCSSIRAAEVLRNVPANALGFVIVRNLERVDADVERLIRNVQFAFPPPLVFLKATAGIGEGLRRDGDFLLAVLPGEKPNQRPDFAVWLPVSNYDQFLSTLEGAGSVRITAVTLAGEDLLVAKHGDWALIMDPDRRTRMERLLQTTSPAATRTIPAAWQPWIEANDITAVLLPSGIRAGWSFVATNKGSREGAIEVFGGQPAGELFGQSQDDDRGDDSETDDGSARGRWSIARRAIQRAAKEMPELAEWAGGTSALACGLRFDDAGNVVGGIRVGLQADLRPAMADWPGGESAIPVLRPNGNFIIIGAGRLPPSVAVAASNGYARFLLASVENDAQGRLERRDKERFIEAVEQAASGITAITLLTLPGEKQDGVYTNQFAAVRVKAASEFLDQASEVMRLWNEMNHDVQGELRLVFDTEEAQIGNRQAIEYSVDMTAALGTPGVPEIREAMEKLFGSEGKLRILIVPDDETTVLLAGATREQTASALKMLEFDESASWDNDDVAQVNRLLPDQSDWRLFFSPHDYNTWLKRQSDAITGPVIGGPLVKDFSSSPPIGAAGGFAESEIWIDVAVPADTVKATAEYLKTR